MLLGPNAVQGPGLVHASAIKPFAPLHMGIKVFPQALLLIRLSTGGPF